MVFSSVKKPGMIPSCENTDTSTTPIGSLGFVLLLRSAVCLGTPRPASSSSPAGGKNGLRHLRDHAPHLLRSHPAPGPGSLLRRHAGVPGASGPTGPVPQVREGEAGVP